MTARGWLALRRRSTAVAICNADVTKAEFREPARGTRGADEGPRGETGAQGCPGRDGRDGITTTRLIGIKKWVRDAEDPYAMRAVMSDGSRTAKIDFRPILADFLHEIDLQGMVRDAVTEAMRTASLKPW